MQLNIPLTGKLRLFLAGGVVVMVLILFVLFLLRSGPTVEEQRLAHLEHLVKVLDAYRKQYGFYPQPTAREETVESFRHVWGYRPGIPALASCTVALGDGSTSLTTGGSTPRSGSGQASSLQESAPDALRSVCGGEIYDRDRRVIGWKGTLTEKSAQNSVEVALKGAGRLFASLSELVKQVPLDPAYAPHSNLMQFGLGEYVYAVRAPEDGSQGKGGVEYQLAATVTDPPTGKRRTLIRGNYFVRSADRETMPPSLIGPGLLLDRFGNPLPDQEHPLHVLLDGQIEGYPNPLIGEGEKILRTLTLHIRAQKLSQAAGARAEIVERLPPSPSVQHLREALLKVQGKVGPVLSALADSTPLRPAFVKTEFTPSIVEGAGRQGFAGQAGSPQEELDLDALETQLRATAEELSAALHTFMQEKAEEVQTVLQQEARDGGAMLQILSGALLPAQEAQEFIPLARDELIKYLEGEGIEEQSRNRAGRKIVSVLESIPNLSALFSAQDLELPLPFLTEEVQSAIAGLVLAEFAGKGKGGTGSVLLQDVPEDAGAGTGSVVDSPQVMVSTIVAEMTELYAELQGILEKLEEEVRSPAVPVEEVDESLRRLARALAKETERIQGLFPQVATAEAVSRSLTEYEQILAEGNQVEAVHAAALFAGQQADFSSFLFSPSILDAVVFEKQPGIPDVSAYENPLEAEYKGIPYPLP